MKVKTVPDKGGAYETVNRHNVEGLNFAYRGRPEGWQGNVSIACGGELYVRVIGAKRNVFWYRRDPQKGFIRLAGFKDLSLAAARKMIGVKTGAAVREPSEILFSEVAQKWLKTKEGLVRYINIKRHVEILKPLYSYKVVLK